MDLATFVDAQLPPTPARVLEIGCGEGDLARPLRAAVTRSSREERSLIEAGRIQAIGFNYVGET
jgi:ubiquinone/menaquinone biosynthesis C-methylase UbiE